MNFTEAAEGLREAAQILENVREDAGSASTYADINIVLRNLDKLKECQETLMDMCYKPLCYVEPRNHLVYVQLKLHGVVITFTSKVEGDWKFISGNSWVDGLPLGER